jgi:hypothetical protein
VTILRAMMFPWMVEIQAGGYESTLNDLLTAVAGYPNTVFSEKFSGSKTYDIL